MRLGQYVKDGDPLYRIADLDPIWLYLNIYEYDLAWVRYGSRWMSRWRRILGNISWNVTFIDPFLDDASRTVRVRVNLSNPDRRLKPQMYANASILVKIQSDGTPEPTVWKANTSAHAPGGCPGRAREMPICEMQLEKVPGIPLADVDTQKRRSRRRERRTFRILGRARSPGGAVSAVLTPDEADRLSSPRRPEPMKWPNCGWGQGPGTDTEGRTREFFPVQARTDRTVIAWPCRRFFSSTANGR